MRPDEEMFGPYSSIYNVFLLEGSASHMEIAMMAEFSTKEEALAAYENPASIPGFLVCLDDADYVELDGPDVQNLRKLRDTNTRDSWKVEV